MGNGSSKAALVLTAILIQAFITYVVIYMTVSRLGESKCVNIFQKPHEQHGIRVKPHTYTFPLNKLEANDIKKLVNLTNFAYVNKKEPACPSEGILLLILIPSAPSNKERRDAIRKSWGDKDEDTIIIFMLGMSEDEEIDNLLKKEIRLYSDIIQGNFVDSYKNLTYKSVMSLKYVIYNCPQANYVLKVDDDSFVNIPLLKNFLKHDLSPYGAENLLLCNDMTGSAPIRDPTSKWFMPKEDFQDDVYPSYCSGWYAIFSLDVCFKLYRESQKLEYLYIDDVFVYGMAASKANLTHTDMRYYTLDYRDSEMVLNGTYDNIPVIFGAPNMNSNLIWTYYQYFKGKPVPLSIYKGF